MHPEPTDVRTCRVCGSPLHPDNKFCAQCGTPVEPLTVQDEPLAADPTPAQPLVEDDVTILGASGQTDPSTLETREFRINDDPFRQSASVPPGSALYETPPDSVPPESGNRTLWIILGIVAAIVLICCCILPLGLLVVANIDTSLHDEIRSSLYRMRL